VKLRWLASCVVLGVLALSYWRLLKSSRANRAAFSFPKVLTESKLKSSALHVGTCKGLQQLVCAGLTAFLKAQCLLIQRFGRPLASKASI
jgi:hypothetical protein